MKLNSTLGEEKKRLLELMQYPLKQAASRQSLARSKSPVKATYDTHGHKEKTVALSKYTQLQDENELLSSENKMMKKKMDQ